MSEWGRVGEDGTVYVRTDDGERAVGSWQAGAPEEGLALYVRRFDALATEVTLLEQRLRGGVGDPAQVATSAQRLKETLPAANAVGDLAGLERRVDALLDKTAEAVEQRKAAKAESRQKAVEQKTALAEEAEQLAGSSDWKTAGERLRTLGEDWKKVHGVDRKTDDELWQRVAAARKRFAERRTAHFSALEQQREVSRERKEKLVREAEALQSSTEWGATAGRYKQLMADWKTAGRAPREVEDQLWARFKAAQDAFFSARNAHFSSQDEELRGNQKVKEEILAEAEGLDLANLDRAKARIRELGAKWDAAGKVPRDVMRSLEDRMAAAERRVREAGESRAAAAPAASPFEAKLRERLAELELKLEKARAAGRPTDDLERQVAGQRELLGVSAAVAPSAAPENKPEKKPEPKRPTTAWVRAE